MRSRIFVRFVHYSGVSKTWSILNKHTLNEICMCAWCVCECEWLLGLSVGHIPKSLYNTVLEHTKIISGLTESGA